LLATLQYLLQESLANLMCKDFSLCFLPTVL
jgi:hypothetical protein